MRLASRVRAVERRVSPAGLCACGLLLVYATRGELVPKDTTCAACGRPKRVVVVSYADKPPRPVTKAAGRTDSARPAGSGQ